MTRRDILKTVHEPFGDAWYFGPERLAERYAEDDDTREASGFAKSTYQKIMERINQDNTEVGYRRPAMCYAHGPLNAALVFRHYACL